MHRLLFIALALALAHVVAAGQGKDAGYHVKAGMTMSTILTDPKDDNIKYKPGFQGGFVIDWPIACNGKLHVLPQILFTMLGGKTKTGSLSGTEEIETYKNNGKTDFRYVVSYSGQINKTKTTLSYLQIPVDLSYRIPLGGGKNPLTFNLDAGPYFGFGLFGKDKTETKTGRGTEIESETSTNNKGHFSGEDGADPLYKLIDFGVRLGVSFNTNGLSGKGHSIGVHYNLGLIDMLYKSNDDLSVKNGALVVSVTF